MATLYVARSATLAKWASDVGLSKHIYKVGLTDEPVKDVIARGWAALTDWTLVSKRDEVEGGDEAGMQDRLAAKERLIDPRLYPKIKGTPGLYKVLPAHVENHIIVTRALTGTEESGELKLKPADFAAYLIHNALKSEGL